MVKKKLYPKTKRISDVKHIITEKLDGSNLGLFKLDGELIIAQRNHVFRYNEIKEDTLYKGLYDWLNENCDDLLEKLHEGSGMFGEWIGMGVLKYNGTDIDKRFYIFAKANIDDNIDVYNIIYNPEMFKYPFIDQEIPEYIGIVPIIELSKYINIPYLDTLYDEYTAIVNRNVEGFVVIYNNHISKYVRMKNGKLEEHKK